MYTYYFSSILLFVDSSNNNRKSFQWITMSMPAARDEAQYADSNIEYVCSTIVIWYE